MTVEEAARHLLTPGNRMTKDLMETVEGENAQDRVYRRVREFGYLVEFDSTENVYEARPYRNPKLQHVWRR